jgi:hypothetical protein
MSPGARRRDAFWINVPCGGVCLVIQYLYVRLPFEKKPHTVDVAGILAIIGATTLLALSITWGGSTYAWDSATVITMLVVAGVLLLVFGVVEHRFAREPVIPIRLFAVRNVAVACWANFFLGFCMTGSYVFLPLFFQYVNGKTATESGIGTCRCDTQKHVAAGCMHMAPCCCRTTSPLHPQRSSR